MKRGGCKSEDGKTRGCLWPKRGGGAVVSKSVNQLKESVPPPPPRAGCMSIGGNDNDIHGALVLNM